MRRAENISNRNFRQNRSDRIDEMERHKRIRNTLRWIGFPLLFIGILLIVLGFILFTSPMHGMGEDPDSWGNSFSDAKNGWIMIAVGAPMFVVGSVLVRFSFLGTVAKYVANESRDAVSIAGDSAGVGLSRGIRRGGGIPLTHMDKGGGDGIKIRCRKCGYLDSEDAKFCSRCGSRL